MDKEEFNTISIYDMYENMYYIVNIARNIVLNEIKDALKNGCKVDKITKVESRIKSYESLIDKMEHKGYELTWDNVVKKINDLIGIRIVCSNLNDIYDLSNLIKNDGRFRIIKEKDYIRNPKESGYTSYHIIFEYVYKVGEVTIPIKAELQIRTEEMDKWANFTHDLIYKRRTQVVG